MHDTRTRVLIAAIVALLAMPLFARNDTVINLQKAYNAEMTARAQYLAYAQKADDEGYGAVGSLFRAAAFAEESQATEHAKLIRSLGMIPRVTPVATTAGTTEENLNAALRTERDEQTTLYEPFIKTAREEKRMESLRSFTRAKTAEAEHQKLLEYTAGRLDQLKGSDAVDYYVCPVCGHITSSAADMSHCPDCGHKVAEYVVVR